MQHGRHTHRLADFLQTRPGGLGPFRCQHPELAALDCGAAGLHDQNVVGDEFLDQAVVA